MVSLVVVVVVVDQGVVMAPLVESHMYNIRPMVPVLVKPIVVAEVVVVVVTRPLIWVSGGGAGAPGGSGFVTIVYTTAT